MALVGHRMGRLLGELSVSTARYCTSLAHSRPPTPEEFREDYAKREAAIERAIEEGSHSAKEIAAARKVLETFTGYTRCTLTEDGRVIQP